MNGVFNGNCCESDIPIERPRLPSSFASETCVGHASGVECIGSQAKFNQHPTFCAQKSIDH